MLIINLYSSYHATSEDATEFEKRMNDDGCLEFDVKFMCGNSQLDCCCILSVVITLEQAGVLAESQRK